MLILKTLLVYIYPFSNQVHKIDPHRKYKTKHIHTNIKHIFEKLVPSVLPLYIKKIYKIKRIRLVLSIILSDLLILDLNKIITLFMKRLEPKASPYRNGQKLFYHMPLLFSFCPISFHHAEFC